MLDPTKSKTDVVAADSKAPTGQLAINSLKQKIIKLESAVKEKDNQLQYDNLLNLENEVTCI